MNLQIHDEKTYTSHEDDEADKQQVKSSQSGLNHLVISFPVFLGLDLGLDLGFEVGLFGPEPADMSSSLHLLLAVLSSPVVVPGEAAVGDGPHLRGRYLAMELLAGGMSKRVRASWIYGRVDLWISGCGGIVGVLLVRKDLLLVSGHDLGRRHLEESSWLEFLLVVINYQSCGVG